MAERSIPTDLQRSPEPLCFQEGLVGLQTRLLIATPEALNPDSELTVVTRDVLGNFADRNYDVFNNASISERRDHWQGKEGDVFDRQKAAWVTSTVATFTSEQAQRFFQSEQGRPWSEAFNRLGINTQGFTPEAAGQLYATYFTDGKSDIKKFVKDCIDKNADQYLSAIQSLANIFGTKSAEIVAQLLDAEKKLQTQPEQLIQEANQETTEGGQQKRRVNKLLQREIELLQFLNASQQQEQQQPTRTQVQHHINQTLQTTGTGEQTQHTDPWSAVPRPNQPVKIADAEIIGNNAPVIPGRMRIGPVRRPERHLYWGTREYPLVQEFIWQDGNREMVRTVNPERPYHIPVELYFDKDITPEQKELIQTTARAVLTEVGVPNNLILESPRSAVEFFSQVPPNQNRPNQTDEQMVLQAVRSDTEQIEKPHHAMVFTNKDLYGGTLNFVVGSAQEDLGTVISLQRIWQGIPDPQLRNQTIQTEIAHEIGHVYTLPSGRRGQANLDNETVRGAGGHCKSPGCSMKQGNAVPDDFVRITQDRMNNLGDHFFCNECHTDLQSKFR